MSKNLAFYFKGKPNATDYKAWAMRIESKIDLDNVVNDCIEYYNNPYNVSK